MDWLLALLALFNVVSMITVFMPRTFRRQRAVASVRVRAALDRARLALAAAAGAADAGMRGRRCGLGTTLGVIALLVLAVSWLGLLRMHLAGSRQRYHRGKRAAARRSAGLPCTHPRRGLARTAQRGRLCRLAPALRDAAPRRRGDPQHRLRGRRHPSAPRPLPPGGHSARGLPGAAADPRRRLDDRHQGTAGAAADVPDGRQRLDLRGGKLPPEPQRRLPHAPARLQGARWRGSARMGANTA